MKYYHAKRLLKLAAFLDKLPKEKFDFRYVLQNTDCGTVGCAIGWCPTVFPKHFKTFKSCVVLKGYPYDNIHAVIEFFNLNSHVKEAQHLFLPYHQTDRYGGKILGNDATPKEVADNIREFIKKVYPRHSKYITQTSN